ncbi:MAG TPA: DUF2461 domain-containing protein [Jatrophihabitans sp.]|nr:DUF2461 domain-containing protein [Jatrophihabitans sp.]
MAGFTGWGPEFVAFFDGLAVHNSKEWFDRHRDLYQSAVRKPTEELVAELAPQYGTGKIFRLNRDARFAVGQPPYHTNIAVEFAGSGVHHYLSASASELIASVGPFRTDSAWVSQYRQVVAGAGGSLLQRILEDLRTAGYTIGGDTLRTAPRGYPPDHPHRELLRHRSITASRRWPAADWVGDRRAIELVQDAWDKAGPLVSWLRRNCPTEEP